MSWLGQPVLTDEANVMIMGFAGRKEQASMRVRRDDLKKAA
jgi:hypothetical protein